MSVSLLNWQQSFCYSLSEDVQRTEVMEESEIEREGQK